jgi:glycosyltransferase involved in cell wall biosynthesis
MQTHTDWELVICKDTVPQEIDDFLNVIASLDDRIRIVSTANTNLPAALNMGIEICSGSFIARFDSDDLMREYRLEVQLEFMLRNLDYVAVGGQVLKIDKFGDMHSNQSYYDRRNDSLKKNIYLKCPFAHPNVMIKRDALLSVGGYDQNFPFAEDYELWLRLASRGKFANLSSITTHYRTYPEQVSAVYSDLTIVNMVRAFLNFEKLLPAESDKWGSVHTAQDLLDLVRHLPANAREIFDKKFGIAVVESFAIANGKQIFRKLRKLSDKAFLLRVIKTIYSRLYSIIYAQVSLKRYNYRLSSYNTSL